MSKFDCPCRQCGRKVRWPLGRGLCPKCHDPEKHIRRVHAAANKAGRPPKRKRRPK